MEINIECSAIINDEYSQFMDENTQLYIEQESIVGGIAAAIESPAKDVVQILPTQLLTTTYSQNALENLPTTYQSVKQQAEAIKSFVSENSVKQESVQQIEAQQTEQQQYVKSPSVTQVVQVQPQQTAGNQSNTWEKVSIMKRRVVNTSVMSGTSSQTHTQKHSTQPTTPIIMVNKQPSVFLQQQLQLQEQHNSAISEAKKTEALLRKKRALARPIEPLPVFDCLFCAQEHFVLFKINEQTLINKFSKDYAEDVMCTYTLIQLLEKYNKKLEDQNLEKKVENAGIQSNKQVQQEGVSNINKSKQDLKDITMGSIKTKPVILKLIGSQLKNSKVNLYSQLPSQPISNTENNQNNQQQNQQQKPNIQIIPQQALMLSNILGQTLNDTNMCINIRNRRQRVLENISFESEVHNIYDPYFTSEEELDSLDSDSKDESSSALSNETITESHNMEEEGGNEEEQDQSNITNTNSLSSIEIDEDEDGDFHSDSQDEEQNNETESEDDEEELLDGDEEAISGQKLRKLQQTSPTPVGGGDDDEDEEEEDDDSERLTFGCVTPTEEDQKVTFSHCGENSLSPVRLIQAEQTLKQIGNSVYNDQLSPKLTLLQNNSRTLSGQSPLSQDILQYQGESMRNARATVPGDIVQHIRNSGGVTSVGNVYHNNTISNNIDFYPSQVNLTQQKSYDTDLRIGNMLSQISKPTEESKDQDSDGDIEDEDDELSSQSDQSQEIFYKQNNINYRQQHNAMFDSKLGGGATHSFNSNLGSFMHQKLNDNGPRSVQIKMSNLKTDKTHKSIDVKQLSKAKIEQIIKKQVQNVSGQNLKHQQVQAQSFEKAGIHRTQKLVTLKNQHNPMISVCQDDDVMLSNQSLDQHKMSQFYYNNQMQQQHHMQNNIRNTDNMLDLRSNPTGSDFSQYQGGGSGTATYDQYTPLSISKSAQSKTSLTNSTKKKVTKKIATKQSKVKLNIQENSGSTLGSKKQSTAGGGGSSTMKQNSTKVIRLTKQDINDFRTTAALCSNRYATNKDPMFASKGPQQHHHQTAIAKPRKQNLQPKTNPSTVKQKSKLQHKRDYSKTSQSNSHHQTSVTNDKYKLGSAKQQPQARKRSNSKQEQQEFMQHNTISNYLNTINKTNSDANLTAWMHTQQNQPSNVSHHTVSVSQSHFSSAIPLQRKRPQKLNGSIEGVQLQTFLSNMDSQNELKRGRTSVSKVNNNNNTTTSLSRQRVNGTTMDNLAVSNQNHHHHHHHNKQGGRGTSSNGQFSFSQSSLKLNLTSSMAKAKNTSKKKKDKKNGGGAVNITGGGYIGGSGVGMSAIHVNTTTSSSNLKNTSSQFVHQNQKKKSQRSRSNSRHSKNTSSLQQQIPSHQLLMTQQPTGQHQLMILKNQQILLGHHNQAKNTISTQKNGAKDKTKLKKLLMLTGDNSTHHSSNNNGMPTTIHNESHINKIKQGQSSQFSMPSTKSQLTTNNSTKQMMNANDKFQSTGKFLMSQVTSPLRALALGGFNNNNNNNNNSNNSGFPHHQSQQSSISVKQSLDLKKSLASEILTGFLNFQKKNSTIDQQKPTNFKGPK